MHGTQRTIAALIMAAFLLVDAPAQSSDPATGRDAWRDCMTKPHEWYASAEAKRIAENVLLYQLATGGWQKNIDMSAPLSDRERDSLEAAKAGPGSTFDNGATVTQMRFLARVFRATGDKRYADAFVRGLDYVLEAQYPNGGWPQFYPLVRGYFSRITFNDSAMTNVLNLLMDIARGRKEFGFVDERRCAGSALAVIRGIECILKCQVKMDGALTVWCAQHDEVTFAPVKARAYELPSLSGNESVSIVRFLMRIDSPSLGVIASVQGAVRWFDGSRIEGIRVIEEPDSTAPHGTNRVVVKDMKAPSMWGRFYDLRTNEVFFCSRDGVPRKNLSEISNERRNHYGWLGDWPKKLLEREYPAWQQRWAPNENVLRQEGVGK